MKATRKDESAGDKVGVGGNGVKVGVSDGVTVGDGVFVSVETDIVLVLGASVGSSDTVAHPARKAKARQIIHFEYIGQPQAF